MNKKFARTVRQKRNKLIDQNKREQEKAELWNKTRLSFESKIQILEEEAHLEFTEANENFIREQICVLCRAPINDVLPDRLFIFDTGGGGQKYFTHVKHFYAEGEPDPDALVRMTTVKTYIVEEEVYKRCGLRIGVDFARPETMQKDRKEKNGV